jgi:hypothetical protein
MKTDLRDIIRRIEKLENKVFSDKTKDRKLVKDEQKKTLPDLIIELRDSGFFSQPRTPVEAHEKLNPKYSCELNRVTMALLRLQRGNQLRKASKRDGEKRVTAYVW